MAEIVVTSAQVARPSVRTGVEGRGGVAGHTEDRGSEEERGEVEGGREEEGVGRAYFALCSICRGREGGRKSDRRSVPQWALIAIYLLLDDPLQVATGHLKVRIHGRLQG